MYDAYFQAFVYKNNYCIHQDFQGVISVDNYHTTSTDTEGLFVAKIICYFSTQIPLFVKAW